MCGGRVGLIFDHGRIDVFIEHVASQDDRIDVLRDHAIEPGARLDLPVHLGEEQAFDLGHLVAKLLVGAAQQANDRLARDRPWLVALEVAHGEPQQGRGDVLIGVVALEFEHAVDLSAHDLARLTFEPLSGERLAPLERHATHDDGAVLPGALVGVMGQILDERQQRWIAHVGDGAVDGAKVERVLELCEERGDAGLDLLLEVGVLRPHAAHHAEREHGVAGEDARAAVLTRGDVGGVLIEVLCHVWLEVGAVDEVEHGARALEDGRGGVFEDPHERLPRLIGARVAERDVHAHGGLGGEGLAAELLDELLGHLGASLEVGLEGRPGVLDADVLVRDTGHVLVEHLLHGLVSHSSHGVELRLCEGGVLAHV